MYRVCVCVCIYIYIYIYIYIWGSREDWQGLCARTPGAAREKNEYIYIYIYIYIYLYLVRHGNFPSLVF